MMTCASLGWWKSATGDVAIANLTVLDDVERNGTASTLVSNSIAPAASDILFLACPARDDGAITFNSPSTTLANATFTDIGTDSDTNGSVFVGLKVWRVTFSGAPGTGTITLNTSSTFQAGMTIGKTSGHNAASPIGQTATNNKASGTSLATTFGGAPDTTSLICSALAENGSDASTTPPSGHSSILADDIGSSVHRELTYRNGGGTATALTWSGLNNEVGVVVSWEVKD